MSHIEAAPSYPVVATFDNDGRKPLHELHREYFRLLKHGWHWELISNQEERQENGNILKLPIFGFLSPKLHKGPEPTLWVIGGIHGEEPASPHAFAQEIETIASLPELGIPTVAIFVANPSGYHRDSRYFNARRDRRIGKSVGDPDHLVPGKFINRIPRRIFPTSKTAFEIARWVLETSKNRQPFLVMDHHEDELLEERKFSDWDYFYSYAYGTQKVLDLICPEIAGILERSGYAVKKDGVTRFGEKIKNGFVPNTVDYSIDQFFASKTYVENFRLKEKSAARAVFVPETIIHHVSPQPIDKRAAVHQDIIRAYPKFWKMLKEVE